MDEENGDGESFPAHAFCREHTLCISLQCMLDIQICDLQNYTGRVQQLKINNATLKNGFRILKKSLEYNYTLLTAVHIMGCENI
jgi:hypothetical protein